MQQTSSTVVSIALLGILLLIYLCRNTVVNSVNDEETSVSLCQVYTQLDESQGLDDRALLSLLATLKMHDFKIGQPVWGPSNILLYLCEHQLKDGPKLSVIVQALKNAATKSNSSPSKHLGWLCV